MRRCHSNPSRTTATHSTFSRVSPETAPIRPRDMSPPHPAKGPVSSAIFGILAGPVAAFVREGSLATLRTTLCHHRGHCARHVINRPNTPAGSGAGLPFSPFAIDP